LCVAASPWLLVETLIVATTARCSWSVDIAARAERAFLSVYLRGKCVCFGSVLIGLDSRPALTKTL